MTTKRDTIINGLKQAEGQPDRELLEGIKDLTANHGLKWPQLLDANQHLHDGFVPVVWERKEIWYRAFNLLYGKRQESITVSNQFIISLWKAAEKGVSWDEIMEALSTMLKGSEK